MQFHITAASPGAVVQKVETTFAWRQKTSNFRRSSLRISISPPTRCHVINHETKQPQSQPESAIPQQPTQQQLDEMYRRENAALANQRVVHKT
jgi:hypothetical protein